LGDHLPPESVITFDRNTQPDWQAKAIAMAVAARKDLRPLAGLRGLVSLRILFSLGPARFDIDCR
jgi:hypothetical protein